MAVKVIPRDCSRIGRKKRVDSVASELNATDLCHDNLVRVYDVFQASKEDDDDDLNDPPPNGTTTATGNARLMQKANTVIIMEYVGKANLLTLIEQYSETITDEFVEK